MELSAGIIQHLRAISEPCNIIELAHALHVLEPGDVVPNRLRSTLTGLVRHGQVKRVHNGDGVLRYMPIGAATPPPADPPALATPVTSMDPPLPPVSPPRRKERSYTTGISDRVLAALVPGAPPVRRTVIEYRLSPPLTTSQVTMALQALRIKGLVVRSGTTSNAGWQRVDGAAPAPAPTTASSTDTTARLGAAHHALLQARLAIDAALQALEA